jgi:IPT/TIG domain
MRSLILAASLLIATTGFALSPSCVTITSVTPSSGPPGTKVVITGTGFASCCPFECSVPSVTFDGAAAQVVSWTDTQLVVIASGHVPGAASLTVAQISGAAMAANAFTFVGAVPTLGAITAGMTVVFLTGVALIRLR